MSTPAKARTSGRRERRSRPLLTHFEVRRGGALRLRIAIADDAIAEAGDELGALLRRIAPPCHVAAAEASAPDQITPDVPEISDETVDFVVTPEHPADDGAYHAGLRERLAELFSSLCDTSLADALDIAREERARRAEGGN